MNSSFFKLKYCTYIIINLFLLILCSFDDCIFYNKNCSNDSGFDLEITYYSNGSINKECKNIFNNETTISSIAYEDKLKLYIYDGNKEDCNYYENDDDANIYSLESCKDKNKTDSNNILCALNVKYKKNENESIVYQACLEVNEYEKDRFKGITEEYYKSLNSNEKPIAYLFCNSELYHIKKLFFFLLFIYIYF